MNIDIIKNKCIELSKKNFGSGFDNFLKKNSDIDDYLSLILKNIPWYETKKNVLICLGKGIEDKIYCKECGKELTIKQAKSGLKFCSKSCSNKNKDKQEKYKKTCLEKYRVENISQLNDIKLKKVNVYLRNYGVDNPFKSEEVKKHIRESMIEKYGSSNPFKSEAIKQKKSNTCLERYGTEFPVQSNEIREKIKRTNLERYGSENLFNCKEIREKIKNTNLERYGTENPGSSILIKEKKRKNCLEKYGVSNCLKIDSVREKSKKTNLKKYGVENILQLKTVREKGVENLRKSKSMKSYNHIVNDWKEYVIPLFTFQEYEGYEKEYRWKCSKCGNEFSSKIYTTDYLKDRFIPRCLKCFPYFYGNSRLEHEVSDFIKELGFNVIENERELIKPYELDIVIPGKNVAIEFDGLYWHSEIKRDSNYHLKKTELCISKDIHLIHIFENEWNEKNEIVKDRIKSILGSYDSVIYARQCEIRDISSTVSNNFLEENHLQGKDNSKIRLGLFYKNSLVSVMTFGKPRFNKKYEVELIRFCNKLGYKIIGGASKLLNFFIKKFNPRSIISYADRRYSTGNLYDKLGFKLIGISRPNYFWFKGTLFYTRYQTQKHKLKKLLGDDFNPELSESENMISNGFHKIYDCGNLIFVYKQVSENE